MSTFQSFREIPATPDQVFAAIRDPQRLARWWGPDGFTTTFSVCDFQPAGRWNLVMHGPDGRDYPNESLFAEIEPPSKVVIDHISEPKFRLTVTLEPSATGTAITWLQVFENAAFANSVAHIIKPANEQNLDRLTAEVLRRSA